MTGHGDKLSKNTTSVGHVYVDPDVELEIIIKGYCPHCNQPIEVKFNVE